MRNLIKYPITKKEILEALDEARILFSDQERLGDIRPICMVEAMRIIGNSRYKFDFKPRQTRINKDKQ